MAKDKHVRIAPGQRLYVRHVKADGTIAEYIAGADSEGVVRMNLAPEQRAPEISAK